MREKWTGPARDCYKSGSRLWRQAISAQNRLMGTQPAPEHLRTDYGVKLMVDYPEWMCIYADGEPTRHFSFAFEGVRNFHVRLFFSVCFLRTTGM